MELTFLHNPRCSKSRATLALLSERGVQPHIVDYLNEPPATDQLKIILRMLGISPRQLMRQQEPEYRELGLDSDLLSDDELITAMHEHPRLIQRPILIANGKAAIGRPPEAILSIL